MKLLHWADQTAEKIIREKGDKDTYTIASGITPSGVVHIGNFREVITVDLIRRALEKRGKKVRFIYSWDDYDTFRKVPVNLPKQDELNNHLREPIVDVPDPFDEEESYARHHELRFEEQVSEVGIAPEFLYQAKKYRSCEYAELIKVALERTEDIKSILNTHRKEPLDDEWLPIEIFAKKDNKDTVKNKKYEGEYTLSYETADGTEETIDFRKEGNVKLKWRVDWPMRWKYEQVDFEPGGKDHSAAGGSFDTGKEIIKLFDFEAPSYIMYEWISIKGGGQFSSSKGVATTLKEVLEIYEPEMVRWLFAGSRPGAEFAISFDVDVIKLYEDFDKVERIYYDEETVKEKEKEKQKRIYELSAVKEPAKKMPFQPSFRHLTNVLLVNELDVEKAVAYYDTKDKERVRKRAVCAKHWLQKYAPEDFTYTVQKEINVDIPEEYKEVLKEVGEVLEKKDFDEVSLHEKFYEIVNEKGLETKEFFKHAYQALINRDKGPKLAHFMLLIGKDRVSELLKKL